MKIISLQAENIKRLTAVEITPTENVIEITGKNGAGKTSVLDSIWWALAGTKSHQSAPIHHGKDTAQIKLDLGDMIVTRKFRKRVTKDKETGEVTGENITTSIIVENAEGARWPSPQTMLDGLLDSLSFDPLDFARKSSADQYATLQKLCNLDFSEEQKENQKDYEERRRMNRVAKDATAAAAQITIPEGTPEEEISITGLLDVQRKAEIFNQSLKDEIERRQSVARHIGDKRETVDGHRKQIDTLRNQIAALEKEIEVLEREADNGDKAFASLPELESPKDIEAIRGKIEKAEETNKHVSQLHRKKQYLEGAATAEKDAKKTADKIKKRNNAIKAKIEAADMPVEGLGFGAGKVMLDGSPFDQASDAEQLRVSCAIAMRANSKLRVIRIRSGSLLDSNSMRILRNMADAMDHQVWIEKVDESGKIGFVIEDGKLKEA